MVHRKNLLCKFVLFFKECEEFINDVFRLPWFAVASDLTIVLWVCCNPDGSEPAGDVFCLTILRFLEKTFEVSKTTEIDAQLLEMLTEFTSAVFPLGGPRHNLGEGTHFLMGLEGSLDMVA